MTRINFILGFLFVLLSHSIFSQLSGNAFLSGQTNHTGIKAKFISTGGTAVTDSTFTTSSGSYSINITGGVYKVVFSKPGYLDYNYNGGSGLVLTNTVSLNNSTLTLGNQVNVTGTVTGNWTSNNSYIVNGNLIIPTGQTLTIQAGTNVRFNGNYSVTVNGSLIANGNQWNPILFTSNLPSPAPANWDRISVNGNGSVFNYCILEYCSFGLYINNCSPIITNNEFRTFDGVAIMASGCNSVISKNWIHDFKYSWYNQGINYDQSNSIIVECNKINDGHGYGIRPFGGGIVRNNVIYDLNTSTGNGFAIQCGSGCTARIENNYLHDCKCGIVIGESITPIPHPYFINNTVVNMQNTGVSLSDNYANGDFINNIFSNCNSGMVQVAPTCTPLCNTTPSVVANNIMFNNTSGNYFGIQITGIGVIVSTNAQGNPVDSYFNMAQDPLFIGNAPPYLTSSSPCINAGKAGYSANIGFDSTAICAATTINVHAIEKEVIEYKLFPNPSNGSINLSINEIISKGEFVMFDALGLKVYSQSIKSGSNSMNFSGLAKGFYSFILTTDYQKKGSGKLIIE